MELAVDVGDADVVQVDEGNPADSAASQGLRRPGADPADADDAHMGSRQNIQGVLAVKPLDATETLRVIIGHGRYLLSYGPTRVVRLGLDQYLGSKELHGQGNFVGRVL